MLPIGILGPGVKRQLVIASEPPFLTKIGPESRVQMRLVGQMWYFTA